MKKGMGKKLAVLVALLFLAAFRASANEATISAIFPDSGLLKLSDGSVFQADEFSHSVLSLWDVGETVNYEKGSGGCKGYWLTPERQAQICLKRSNEKIISVQVVQTETAKAVITKSSAFASALPIKIGSTTVATASGSEASVSQEVTKLVAEDVVLNDQRVKLRCGSCHPLNPGDYQAILHGDKLWIVSYGMEWDKHLEKLTQRTYEEQWKIIGAWQ